VKLPVNYNNIDFKERRKVREEYIRLQAGMCYYCGAPLTGPPTDETLEKRIKKQLYPEGFFNWPVHLHHNHITGMTIGAVHCYCNAVMWEWCGE
jgi:hypothetical protein